MRTKLTQGELDVRTQFQKRGVALVERIADWRRTGDDSPMALIGVTETFLRDWLATVEEP